MARPKSLEPKKNRLELRLTDAELDEIEYVAEALGIDRSKAIIQTMTERADEIYRVRTARNQSQDDRR